MSTVTPCEFVTFTNGTTSFKVLRSIVESQSTFPFCYETGECLVYLTDEDMQALRWRFEEPDTRRVIVLEYDHFHISKRRVSIDCAIAGTHLDAPGVKMLRDEINQPLKVVAEEGKTELLRLLLARGLRTDEIVKFGAFMFWKAVQSSQFEFAEYFYDALNHRVAWRTYGMDQLEYKRWFGRRTTNLLHIALETSLEVFEWATMKTRLLEYPEYKKMVTQSIGEINRIDLELEGMTVPHWLAVLQGAEGIKTDDERVRYTIKKNLALRTLSEPHYHLFMPTVEFLGLLPLDEEFLFEVCKSTRAIQWLHENGHIDERLIDGLLFNFLGLQGEDDADSTEQYLNVMRYFLEHGANPHVTAANGGTLLHRLAGFKQSQHGDAEDLRAMLTLLVDEQHVDLGVRDNDGKTAFERVVTPEPYAGGQNQVWRPFVKRYEREHAPPETALEHFNVALKEDVN